MMWNSFNTGDYSGMIAETISLKGNNGDTIRAYYSRPIGAASYGSILLIPHMPGWDEFTREVARRFTEHNYAVISPDLYCRFGTGTPTEMSRIARENGGNSDEQVMGDCAACIDFLREQPNSNGRIGVIGMCSGGRHTFLAACTIEGIDAAVDLWGGGVMPNEEGGKAPIDYAEGLDCPLLGFFGNDDKRPSPEQVDAQEKVLKDLGKDVTFYRYDGAGHAFWCYEKDAYRIAPAMDSWNKTLEFFEKYLR